MAEGARRAVVAMDPERDYDAMEDVRTLAKAHAIKSDKKRHAKAKAHAKKLVAHYGKVMEPGSSPKGDKQSDSSGGSGY